MDRVVDEKVKRFSSSNELRFCSSENEIPASGWAIHASAKLRQIVASRSFGGIEIVDSAGVSWSAAEGEEFSANVCQVFVDGQFVGDAKAVELAIVDRRPYTELIWLPVPAYD